MAENVAFRLGYVPGVTPGKWAGIWRERFEAPLELIDITQADVPSALDHLDALVGRQSAQVDGVPGLARIVLYAERTVVVLPRDHVVIAASDDNHDVLIVDIAGETLLTSIEDVLDVPFGVPAEIAPSATVSDTLDLVAAGIGMAVMPLSLARLHHRRDLAYRPLKTDLASVVALMWPQDRTTMAVDDFIGIVKGRTAQSTRGMRAQESRTPAAPARAATPQPRRSRARSQKGRGRSGR